MSMSYQQKYGRTIVPRMEPISMSFKSKKKNNNNGNSDTIFKGRIFICDDYDFHEIYNTEMEKEYNQLYTELPPKNKRPRIVEPILDLPEGEQELFFMGPKPGGVCMDEDFTLLVLDDDEDEQELKFSLKCSPPPCPGDFCWGKCNRAYWKFDDHPDTFNKVSVIKVDGDFGSLKLHFVPFKDSEVLRVQVKWIPKQKPPCAAGTYDDILICGEVTVSCPIVDCKNYLLKTPPDKAIKVSAELPIPLLKSAVSFPRDSGLIISADLVTPPAFDDVNDSAQITVRGSVDFSKCLTEETSIFVSGFNGPDFEVQPSDEKDRLSKLKKYTCAFFCGSTKIIEGNGADLQVSIYMKIYT